ncbi:MAG: hypothetical protein COT73_06635 [Bdellovibrio sp. CG10_big_fil_rev_8_21_14_0_10_47_8]|nr:MAG: hypothetical protein COT73_06635 [Bdellovibrio sp. CG10_big_fil_rev_8_21_14_0_10_47_8]
MKLKIFGSSFIFVFIFSIPFQALATNHELSVDPAKTDSKILQIKGPHLARWSDGESQKNLLLVSLGGTNSMPADFREFQETAVVLGFHGVSIDYPNQVVSTSCRGKNPDCFDHFRQEIVAGDSVSNLIEVNRSNSIENRIEKLILYLASQDRDQWGPFLCPDSNSKKESVCWDRLVLLGHSQGTGHAAFLAKRHEVHGVILVAGPQDGGEAPWLRTKSQTPPERILFLLHEKDFFGVDQQLAAAKALLSQKSPSVIYFQNQIDEKSSAQIFVSQLEVGEPHLDLIKPVFKKTWLSFLERF